MCPCASHTNPDPAPCLGTSSGMSEYGFEYPPVPGGSAGLASAVTATTDGEQYANSETAFSSSKKSPRAPVTFDDDDDVDSSSVCVDPDDDPEKNDTCLSKDTC